MSQKTLWNISTQQIQIFIKAVELKNFTQVANYFNFTPSMISKTISAMEEELGLNLFVRKPHDLSPTPTAVFLAREWRQTIGALNNSIEKALVFQQNSIHKIVLGFVDSSQVVDDLITNSIRGYKAVHPTVSIITEKHDMHRSVELLNTGLLDLALTSNMEVPYLDAHQLNWEKIVDTNAAVFVPVSNPLFNMEHISYDELCTQTFLALNPTMHPAYNDWLLKVCGSHGFVPNIAGTYRTVRSLMFSLKLYSHVFIGDSINEDWCDEDLKMFRLQEQVFTLIAWRNDATEEILDFKQFLKNNYPERL